MREGVSPEVGAAHVALSAAPVAVSTSDAALSCPEPARVELDYDEPVPVRTIAADTVEQWGLRAEGLDVVPRDSSRKFYWTLNTASALSVLSRDAEWTWYRDGDAVRFVRRDDPVLRTAGVVPTEFSVVAERAEGGLLVSVVSDLDDRREVTVTVDRIFAAEDSDDERSWRYLQQCGLAGQWRSPTLLPLDDTAWADGLLEKQDSMARLGPDLAFDVEAPSERVRVRARYRDHEAETAVLAPLSVPLRTGPSPEVGAGYLELRQSYRLRSEVPLTGLLTDPGSRAGRLSVGDVVRVLAAERSGFSPDYLVEGQWAARVDQQHRAHARGRDPRVRLIRGGPPDERNLPGAVGPSVAALRRLCLHPRGRDQGRRRGGAGGQDARGRADAAVAGRRRGRTGRRGR